MSSIESLMNQVLSSAYELSVGSYDRLTVTEFIEAQAAEEAQFSSLRQLEPEADNES